MAAKQGHAGATYNLAIMYDNGEGTSEDNAKALQLYTQAAKTGHGNAAFNLAVMYRDGESTSKDAAKAYYWFGVSNLVDTEDAADQQKKAGLRLSAVQIKKLDGDIASFAQKLKN
jgi:TPR repeat protein